MRGESASSSPGNVDAIVFVVSVVRVMRRWVGYARRL